ncbi:MAG TPA: ferredoxin [Syntrophobacteraceae bacterium]|nr:ferredoxin [Syntrophobacteraceae bacterium]
MKCRWLSSSIRDKGKGETVGPVTVDLDDEGCLGCGACADLCPEVFEMDDRSRRKARVIIFEVRDRSCVQEAIAACPAECIFWRA